MPGVTTMFAGDSITVGYPPVGGPGFRKLVADHLPGHVFVGSQITDASGLRHEGYGGFPIARIKTAILGSASSKGALSQFDPIQVVLLAGTNDLGTSKTPQQIVDELKGLVTNGQAQGKTTQFYVLELPKASGFQSKAASVNSLLREQAPTWQGGGTFAPHAVFVPLTELNAAFDIDPKNVLADGTHPNARGYAMMARAITHALGGDANAIPLPGSAPVPKPDSGGHVWHDGPNGETLIQQADGSFAAPVLKTNDGALFQRNVIGRWTGLAGDAFVKTGVPIPWTLGVIWAESGGNPNARNKETPPGLGLMQITSPALKGGLSDAEVMDPVTNISIGTRFLAFIRDHGVHDLPSAASIYNCGAAADPPFRAKKSTKDARWGLCNSPGYIDRVVQAANTYVLGISGGDVVIPPHPPPSSGTATGGGFILAVGIGGAAIAAYLLARG